MLTADGRALVYQVDRFGTTGTEGADVWYRMLTGDSTPKPIAASPFVEHEPRVSPDGKWVAFMTNASGANQVGQPFCLPARHGGLRERHRTRPRPVQEAALAVSAKRFSRTSIVIGLTMCTSKLDSRRLFFASSAPYPVRATKRELGFASCRRRRASS